jgi:DtxR family Mn-dependent transcriptional regulator
MNGLSDRAEEILEQLWILIEEQRAQPALEVLRDDEAFGSLCEMGLVRLDDNGVALTSQGRKEAEGCVRRHRLAERLLVDVLDTADDEMHRTGCKLEHSLHRGLEERVCTILGHPRACPHGKPIPPGECCRRLEREVEPLLTTAADLPTDEPAVIAYLSSKDVADLRKLMAMGALPGTGIVVRQRFPSYLVDLGASQFGIDEHMARQIHVRREAPGKHRRRRHGVSS